MSVERLDREVTGRFGVSAVAMRDQRDDIAVATRSLRNRAREAGYREWAGACLGRAEVSRLMSREVLRDRNIEGPRQIRTYFGAAGQLDACFQRARSITVPQFEQVRRSALA